jgi:hypothetical protein
VRSRLWLLSFCALVFLTGSGGSCSEGSREPTTPEPPAVVAPTLGTPDLRLVVVTDLMGMLEPCGCTSRPLGGIDGLAAALSAARSEVPRTLFVSAGDVFYGATHPSDLPGALTQDTWRADLVADLLSDFDLAAAVPGSHDLEHGVARFSELRARTRVPLLGAGVSFDAPPPVVAPPVEGTPAVEGTPPAAAPEPLAGHRIVDVGGLQIALVGVGDITAAGVHVPDDLVARAESEARAARAGGAQLVVALVTADRRTARRIAASTEIDLVVEGGRDEATVRPPASEESAPIVHAGRHGQGLVVIDLFGPFEAQRRLADVSVWTRTAERDHLVADAAALRTRLGDWEREGRAASELADMRARLAEAETRIAAVVAAPSATGPRLSARLVELPPEAPRDASVRGRMDDYFRRVNDHNREAFASHLPAPAPEGAPRYVGSDTCGSCHTEEHAWWRTTLHGHAYRTLEERHKEFNLDCVGCHVTGYERPGGSTVSHVGELADVGCENCHGPGSLHAADPAGAAVNVHREVTEEVCLHCHTPEHSDRFVYDVYRRMMITPEHGGSE